MKSFVTAEKDGSLDSVKSKRDELKAKREEENERMQDKKQGTVINSCIKRV